MIWDNVYFLRVQLFGNDSFWTIFTWEGSGGLEKERIWIIISLEGCDGLLRIVVG